MQKWRPRRLFVLLLLLVMIRCCGYLPWHEKLAKWARDIVGIMTSTASALDALVCHSRWKNILGDALQQGLCSRSSVPLLFF